RKHEPQKQTESNAADNNNVDSRSNANDVPQNLKRKFRQEWQISFDWLQNKNGTAFCVACSKALVSHLTHLKAHAKTSLYVTNYNSQKKCKNTELF
uniref:Uncharacterized protein n=1 Tax=Musca domestica TaxID=7370 RepID=A0A1I8NJG7_MUSDO